MALVLDAARYAGVNARVRGLISRLIPDWLWAELLAAPDLPSLLSPLEQSWHRPVLANLEGRPQAAALERRLWRHLVAVSRSPIHLLQGGPRALLDWHWRRFEVDNLKTVLRAVHHRASAEALEATLIPLGPGSRLPWRALGESSSVPALVERLQGTFYGPVLEQALDTYRREGQLFVLEVALDLAYFGRLLRLIAQLGGRDRQEARRFLGFWVESQNLLWAYRYRIYAGLSPEEILNYTLHRGLRVDAAAVREIALGAPLAEMVARFWDGAIPGLEQLQERPEPEALPLLELLFQRHLHRMAQSTLDKYSLHLGIVLAFQVLLFDEIQDLVTLIEGKAAGWSQEQIQPYLIAPRGPGRG